MTLTVEGGRNIIRAITNSGDVDRGDYTMSKLMRISIAILGSLVAIVPAFAHHSITAEFSPGKEFTVSGVLTRIEWTNPHIYWFVDVKNENGQIETYAFQGGPPSMYHRVGLRKADWKVGEVVTVTAIAAKDGTKTLGFGELVKYSDGHEIVLNH